MLPDFYYGFPAFTVNIRFSTIWGLIQNSDSREDPSAILEEASNGRSALKARDELARVAFYLYMIDDPLVLKKWRNGAGALHGFELMSMISALSLADQLPTELFIKALRLQKDEPNAEALQWWSEAESRLPALGARMVERLDNFVGGWVVTSAASPRRESLEDDWHVEQMRGGWGLPVRLRLTAGRWLMGASLLDAAVMVHDRVARRAALAKRYQPHAPQGLTPFFVELGELAGDVWL